MFQKPVVYVIGVGMTKFEKPGKKDDLDYPQMAKEAVTNALEDARISYSSVKAVCAAYVYGESTCGQRAIYEMGLTSCPIYNVNNNCSSGSSALHLAKQIVESGNADCVLALGFERMERGAISLKYADRVHPLDKHVRLMKDIAGITKSPIAVQMFGNAGMEHMKKYGTTFEHFAKIAYKNHSHSKNNPYAQFQVEYSLQQIMDSPKVFGPLTKLQCCPTSDGAASVILANEKFVRKHKLEQQAVEILAMEMSSDPAATFAARSCINLVGYEMTRNAAQKLFTSANCKPCDVDVVELHDCFSVNELITYEALGLCPEGRGAELVDTGNNTYGGKYVVNPSGGLISKGHPLGATGLAQCTELCWQLRGEAGKRQVQDAKLALQHNMGIGGAVVVALYRLGDFKQRLAIGQIADVQSNPFTVSAFFRTLESVMQKNSEGSVGDMRGVYGFKITNGPGGAEGYWVVDFKTGKIEYNDTSLADVTFTISDDDTVDLITEKLYATGSLVSEEGKDLRKHGVHDEIGRFTKDC